VCVCVCSRPILFIYFKKRFENEESRLGAALLLCFVLLASANREPIQHASAVFSDGTEASTKITQQRSHYNSNTHIACCFYLVNETFSVGSICPKETK